MQQARETGHPLRIDSTIPTPWTPYAVTFSHDGTRIAIGGGAFYGDGGILLMRLSTGEAALVTHGAMPQSTRMGGTSAVSRLCFSSGDGLLAASTWVGRHHGHSTLLFDVASVRLTHWQTVNDTHPDQGWHCSTGVLLHQNWVITRYNASDPAGTLSIRARPECSGDDPGTPVPYLTHNGLAVVRGTVVTGGWFPLRLPRGTGARDICTRPDPLVLSTLDGLRPEVSAIDVPRCHRVTAIQSIPSGEGFITGGLDGEIDEWTWTARTWTPTRLRERRGDHVHRGRPHGPTYSNYSIVGICYLPDRRHWVTVDGGGDLCLWRDRECLWWQEIPVPGTPRSLAVHPSTGHIAIGMKQGDWASPASCVVIVAVDTRDGGAGSLRLGGDHSTSGRQADMRILFSRIGKSLPAGTLLGSYEILRVIGDGGVGEVYEARDTRIETSVALNVLAPEIADDPAARARFRSVAALDHPHICSMCDVGEANGMHYLVMPLLEGQTLAARLAQGPLPLDQAMAFAIQIADALDKAHRQGIVHWDLKPANIMLSTAGAATTNTPHAKLLDFGLTRLRLAAGPISMSGTAKMSTDTPVVALDRILGVVHYLAPEQVKGKGADARSDIWALGALIYEMVTGVPPFAGDTPAVVIGAILKDHPPPVSATQPLAPDALDQLVRGALNKDPGQRWQSAAEVGCRLAWIARILTRSARCSAREQDRARHP